MGGNRPRNHTQARYVTVVDRRNGVINYYALDQFGTLIQINGVPRLDFTFRLNLSNQANNLTESDNASNESQESSPTETEPETTPDATQPEKEFVEFHFYDEFIFEDAFKNYDDIWSSL